MASDSCDEGIVHESSDSHCYSGQAAVESAREREVLLTRGHLLSVMARMELVEAHDILYWK